MTEVESKFSDSKSQHFILNTIYIDSHYLLLV